MLHAGSSGLAGAARPRRQFPKLEQDVPAQLSYLAQVIEIGNFTVRKIVAVIMWRGIAVEIRKVRLQAIPVRIFARDQQVIFANPFPPLGAALRAEQRVCRRAHDAAESENFLKFSFRMDSHGDGNGRRLPQPALERRPQIRWRSPGELMAADIHQTSLMHGGFAVYQNTQPEFVSSTAVTERSPPR